MIANKQLSGRPVGMQGMKHTAPLKSLGVSRRQQTVSALFGGAKGKASAGPALVCVDCGYIYTDKKVDFADLPGSYRCPVCAADKKRFKEFEGPVSRSNDNKAMATRVEALREQLEARGESVDEDNSLLIYSLGFVAVVLGASYYFTVLAR